MVWLLLSLSLRCVLYLQPDPLFIACFSCWSSHLQRTKIHAWPPSSQVIGRRIYGTLRHCWNETPGDNLDDSADLLILHFGFNLFSWECQNGSLLMGIGLKSKNHRAPNHPFTICLIWPAIILLHMQFSYASKFQRLRNFDLSPSLRPWRRTYVWVFLMGRLEADRVSSIRFGLVKNIVIT